MGHKRNKRRSRLARRAARLARRAAKVGIGAATFVPGFRAVRGVSRIARRAVRSRKVLAGAAVVGGVLGARKLLGRGKGRAGVTGIGRRKRLVPKVVAKYINKMSRRRKAEEKAVRKLISASGVRKVFRGSFGSKGVITKAEAARALRK